MFTFAILSKLPVSQGFSKVLIEEFDHETSNLMDLFSYHRNSI